MMLNIIFCLIIKGNEHIKTHTILNAMQQNGVDAVLEIYKKKGFINVKIETKADTIFIEEGNQYKVGKIKFTGNTIFTDKELIKLMHTKKEKIFNENIFNQDMATILKKYANNGYPFCEITPFGFELSENRINFGLKITENKLFQIKDINIIGNRKTKDYVILREAQIKKNSIYREDKINNAKKRILKLNFIDSVNININRDEENLIIYIKEKKMNLLTALLGYSKKELAGMINFNTSNIFGTGREASLEWNKANEFAFFEFNYKEPYIFNSLTKLLLSFLHRQETYYKKDEFESILSIPISTNFNINLGNKIRLSSLWVNENLLSHKKEYFGILGINYSTYTKPGIDYKIKTEINKKGLERYIINMNNYIKLGMIDLFLGTNFVNILQEVPIYEQFKIGGAKTLRGFNEEEFTTKKVIWANIEPQLYIDKNTYLFVFYDIAYFASIQVDEAFMHRYFLKTEFDGLIKQSYGFGISILSGIGKIKIVYGLEKGAPFINGKIHIIAETQF